MNWVIHCDCGQDVSGPSEDEFVATAIEHARTSHAMTMTREQVLGLATVDSSPPRG